MVLLFATAVCQISTMLLGNPGFNLSLLPKGDCAKCCPIDEERDIRFLLYTRENPYAAEQLHILRPLSTLSHMNPRRPTVIYLHGFTENAPGESSTTMRDAYLSTGDYNVILVDWGALITLPWYISAVRNASYMARVLAKFVIWLRSLGIPTTALHIIGFSLGAEAAGLAGKYLAKRGVHLGRITGLDPAFPLYNLMGRQGHLSSGDALFVDVIHTNAGVFGYPTAIGDVDFYPNPQSSIQPGCSPHEVGRRLDMLVSCSHSRAWALYAESVLNPYGFPAWRCLSAKCRRKRRAYMGIAANPKYRGRFYLTTNSRKPFARNL